MEIRPNWTKEELDAIFSKGKVSPLFPPPEYRVDDYGKLIMRSQHGNTKSTLGWDVDHIKSIDDGGSNDLSNLRPLSISINRGRNN